MSSWKNALPRREHRERAQLGRREQLGTLEKKKDYVLRAKDFHRKERRLKALKEKAALRNPEEFYHGMIRGTAGKKTRDGVRERTAEEQRLASERDLGYVFTRASVDASKVEKLKAQLHFLGDAEAQSSRTHTVFVEDEEEQRDFDAAEHFGVRRDLLGRTFNRPREDDIDKMALHSRGDGSIVRAERKKAADYRELSQRVKRSKKLKNLGLSINMEKNLRGKGAKRKVKARDPWTNEPAVYKWQKRRLR